MTQSGRRRMPRGMCKYTDAAYGKVDAASMGISMARFIIPPSKARNLFHGPRCWEAAVGHSQSVMVCLAGTGIARGALYVIRDRSPYAFPLRSSRSLAPVSIGVRGFSLPHRILLSLYHPTPILTPMPE